MVFEPLVMDGIGVLDKKGIEKAYPIGFENASRKFNDQFISHSSELRGL